MIDLARVIASHGVKATIVTTPHNAVLFRKPIHRDQQLGRDIGFLTIDFPAKEFGLPDGCENELSTTSGDMFTKLFMAAMKLQEPLEKLLRKTQPDCLVSDRLYPWTACVSNGLGIPRIVFDGTGCFSHCVEESLRRYSPHEKVVSETEYFILPGLPDRIELKRSMMPDYVKTENVLSLFLKEALEGELKSYGVVVNSFYELEKSYADFFNKEMGRKTWHIGPVSLCNRKNIDKLERGIQTSIDEQTCLNWLDCKEPGSVLYISFGSMPRITPSQLLEIAYGLEASKHPFIWVIGRILRSTEKEQGEKDEDLLPKGFDKRMKESKRGLIIYGWAPQLLILEHKAVGGYMNHCGWNSIIEGVTAGLPMITWPFASEQFYNERFVIDVIRIGISIGSEEWVPLKEESRVVVKRDKVKDVVDYLMDGEEVEVIEMRKRAQDFAGKAKKAVERGGSSDASIDAFIQELSKFRRESNGVMQPVKRLDIHDDDDDDHQKELLRWVRICHEFTSL
ncbi:probable UDP-glucosyl transferase 73B6 [Ziziphus jujuba]|uniref:Probable UDP-glucosyl transferase 73B6 n=1 Tax=Ziziphus jujuba TaxID=326968 RepID=A0A6P4ACQ7_ZIZJJ|nr:probable UDP-glucosyl transferase 73B6 [Ziziphus jujuba]